MKKTYKPILFSTEMVKATLDNRKKLTRRTQGLEPINKEPNEWIFDRRVGNQFIFISKYNNQKQWFLTPKLNELDILWVRETWQTTYNESSNKWDSIYRADGGFWIDDDGPIKWKPSIYMPKNRARIFLEVTNVRVERLADISEEDAIAEGIEFFNHGYGGSPVGIWYKNYLYGGFNLQPNSSFKSLWQKINGIDSWKANPWVWVYEFKVVEKPKDFLYE